MPFYYDHISGKLGTAQYYQFLENETYIRQLKSVSSDATNYQLAEVRRTLQTISPESKENFERLTTKVCGTLESGFKSIVSEISETNELIAESNWRLNEVNESINRLHSMLDWKTDMIIEEQRITNFYLGKIIKLLKIPDSQKQRGYHVEQGLTFLKNAIFEGTKSDFYTDALEEFQKAYEIEAKDYFTLHKLGLIYFNSLKHYDPEKADAFFRNSARYSRAAANAAPNTGGVNYRVHDESPLSKDTLLTECASALNYVSRCNYVLNNKSDTIQFAKDAYEINKKNPEYGLQLAKAYAANDNVSEAIPILSETIDLDRNYFTKCITDPDFISRKKIVDFLDEKATHYFHKVKNRITHLKSLLIDDSTAKDDLNKVEKICSSENYINARIANEEINKKRKYTVVGYTYEKYHLDNPNYASRYFTTAIKSDKTQHELNLEEVIKLENKNFLQKKEFEILDQKKGVIAYNAGKKEDSDQLIRRIIIIVVPIAALIATYNVSKVYFVLIFLVSIGIVNKFWSDPFWKD